MIPILAMALAACIPVDAPHDQLTAADLARAIPEWSAIASDTAVAIAPAPGVQRVIRAPELRRLAARFNAPVENVTEPCFVRPLAPISAEVVLDRMHAQLPNAHIEILETSRAAAPLGAIDFPVSGLRSGYWYGHVTYGAGHRFVVWARVKVTTIVQRVVASGDIAVGELVNASKLSMVERTIALPDISGEQHSGAESVDDIAGRVARKAISAGTPIRKDWFGAPQLVLKGDTVTVNVVAGGAQLKLSAVAESSGALGDLISVQNPDSKRRFKARVEDRGKVSVKGSL